MQDLNPVIIDNGSGIIKAGFAGDQHPRAVFSTIVGRPRRPNVASATSLKEQYIGDEALTNKAGTSDSNPNVMCAAKSEKTTDRTIEGDYVKMEDIESEGIEDEDKVFENDGDIRVIVNARYSHLLEKNIFTL